MRARTRRVIHCLALATVCASAPAASWADGARHLGRLEQESVDEALVALGLLLDPRPEGKVIGHIHIVNQEVFSRRDWLFQLLNIFHRTTRPYIVQRELLIQPGQPYDNELIEESIRNLQSSSSLRIANRDAFSAPELSSVVAITPVLSATPGAVDLLVVTRDLWSLRFNTAFEFQQNNLSYLATSLSENNLLGWRKYLAVGFQMDQGKAGVGPTYYDPNVAGTRLTLMASAIAWYARDDRHYEGDNEIFSLRYPLYSLASRWGGGVDVSHQDAVVRAFRGNSLRQEDLASTPDVTEALPYIYRRRIVTVDASAVLAVRYWGGAVVQRVTLGHRLDRRRSQVLPDFPVNPVDPGNPSWAAEFLAEFAPVSETRSEPYARYELFTPRYAVFRNLDTFDLRENHRLGPWLTLEIAAGLPALGADFQAFPMSGTVGWAGDPAGSYVYGLVQASVRLRGTSGTGGTGISGIDQNLGGRVYAASPPLGRALRVVVMAETNSVRADTHRTRFFLGGSTGLRGYVIGDFDGTTEAIAHVEVRSSPLEIFSQRFGTLLFYDVGHAAPSFRALVPHHDLGLGLRWLIPQLNSSVLRFDWAVATQSTTLTRAGFPGRFTAGYLQTF